MGGFVLAQDSHCFLFMLAWLSCQPESQEVKGMKTFVTILALLALSAAVPAFAAENAPPSVPLDLAASSSPACSSGVASAVLGPQNSELPWLMAEPLLWSEELESLSWLGAGCAAYCRACDGCCAILGPNRCACC
jgi:hypothetical protein